MATPTFKTFNHEYTLEEIQQYINDSNESECDIQDLMGGDLATIPQLMQGLINHIKAQEASKYVVIEKVCGDPSIAIITTNKNEAQETFNQIVKESGYNISEDDNSFANGSDDCSVVIKIYP
jgi:hypothetical protein